MFLFGLPSHAALAFATLALSPIALADGSAYEEQKFSGSQAAYFDSFAYDLEVDGSTLVVGSLEMNFPDFGPGSAYVFERGAGGWVEVARLTAPDGMSHPPSGLGWSVALAGNVAVAGAPGHGLSGSAYVYARGATDWTFASQLWPSDMPDGGRFGEESSVYDSRVLIGGPTRMLDSTRPGQVYVYEASGGAWTESAILSAFDGEVADVFGSQIVQGPERIVIAAPGMDGMGTQRGAVYIYRTTASGWILEQKIEPNDAADGDLFGTSLALDGTTLLVGSASGGGSIYAFERSHSTWSQQQKITVPHAAGLGAHIDLDGERAVAGTPGDSQDGSVTGAAWLLERKAGQWSAVQRIAAGDGAEQSEFGGAVSLDRESVIIGASLASDSENWSGAAYAFRWPAEVAGAAAFCFGDGSATACPCGNSSAIGAGAGCMNSSGLGARLGVYGSASLLADDMSFAASALPATQVALLFVGVDQLAGGSGAVFGDGLRCVGTSVLRLGLAFADASGGAVWNPSQVTAGGWMIGDMRHFQAWYRDPIGSPCGSGFNLSNGVSLTFLP